MTTSNNHSLANTIPASLKNQLPIFQVIGDKLPAAVKTPEAKKTFSALVFWVLMIGGVIAFVKYLPLLLEYAQKKVYCLYYLVLYSSCC
ncbi:hypothetical protein KRR40_21725 [Niabella defluvii]|nr:hypothetical protein KRR40_21725 [Niabella sp. I65]